MAQHGREIAQIVRGENRTLSDSEFREILDASISYYPNDLLVVGWSAAFVFDNPAAAGPTIQLLEYANTQLLEFRHYDELLTRVLAGVYRSIDKGTGVWRRWGLAGEAESLNTVRLDVIEIAERTETSIKFLSDMFYARMYRLAAARVGVPDYRRLVDQKLQTAGELYEFMVGPIRSRPGVFSRSGRRDHSADRNRISVSQERIASRSGDLQGAVVLNLWGIESVASTNPKRTARTGSVISGVRPGR